MIVVLKNNKDFKQKLSGILDSADISGEVFIKILVDKLLFASIQKQMDSGGYGMLKNPGYKLYIIDDKKVELGIVDFYI